MIEEWEDPWFAPPRRGVDNNPVTPIMRVDSPDNQQDMPQAAEATHVVHIDAENAHEEGAEGRSAHDKRETHTKNHDNGKTHHAVKRGVLWARPKLQFDWGQPDRHRKVTATVSFPRCMRVCCFVMAWLGNWRACLRWIGQKYSRT